MSEDRTQIGVKVDSALLQEFRNDVERRYGSTYGHMRTELENAIQAYLDGSDGGDTLDRLKRIEQKLDNLPADVSHQKQKNKDGGVGSRVEDRLEDVIERVKKEADGAPRVHERVVEMAIQDIAGYSQPTMNQYKNLLQDREVAFPDPRNEQSHFYLDAPQYCQAVNEMVQDREIGQDKYVEIVEDEFSRDWWSKQLERLDHDQSDDGSVAFQ